MTLPAQDAAAAHRTGVSPSSVDAAARERGHADSPARSLEGEGHLARSFPPKPVAFARGVGHELFTADGAKYVDLGGASHGVANFGHNHPRIVQAIQQQAGELVHTTMTLPNAVRAQFLDALHAILPVHLTKTFLANSGTEAVECAMKYAITATGRTKFVALRNSFHGRTVGALSATFRPPYRKPFADVLLDVTFVPANDEDALAAAVTNETAAVIVEPVQGEGGLTVLSDAYLQACQRVAHASGALFIVDEIQTGLGRTGSDFAVMPSGAQPDIFLLGKSLAGGLPIGTCSMTDAVAAKMPAGGHGNTFGGSPLVCAAATAALQVLRDEDLCRQAHETGQQVLRRLQAIASPLVREVRGKGLMIGVDLRIKAQPVLDRLLREGWLALAAGPTVVRWLPPLATPRGVLDDAVDALARALADPALMPTGPEADA